MQVKLSTKLWEMNHLVGLVITTSLVFDYLAIAWVVVI